MPKTNKQSPIQAQFHPLLAEKLASFISKQLQAVDYAELCNEFNIAGVDAQSELNAALASLETEGRIMHTREGSFCLPEHQGLFSGTVIGHREGFGFLKRGTGKDGFIPQHQMQSLMPGDFILAKEGGTDRKGRKEVRVVRVLKSRDDGIVGRYFVEHGMAFVVPDDTRISHEIIIESDKRKGARHGQMVVVQITTRPNKRSSAVGKVTEVLGDHMAPGMEIDVALRNYDIPHKWPKRVEKESEHFGEAVPEQAKQGRIDLRQLPLVTIDGEDARDFDDAVYCERKKSGGWRLWVAIADVSYYVRPGSALDTEAYNRSTSVYFPEHVVPMLPEVLSNGLCSLNPHVDRLCMVAEMTVSERGNLSGYQFYPAVMNSHARLTYTKVGKMLDGDEALCEKHADVLPHVQCLHEMYLALKGAREERGAIEFETPEPRFIFNAERKIDTIELVVRNDAHKLIEESMILANVAAAKYITKHKAQALFRVHEPPNGEKLTSFIGFLAELGIEFKAEADITPKMYKTLVDAIQGRPDQELIQTMLLRSMKQAIYSNDNQGHFGLALGAYSHFTSPIRRYPDLLLHRAIKHIWVSQNAKQSNIGEHAHSAEEMDGFGEHTSMAERRADEATRDVTNWLKCEFMRDHIGATYHGVIAAVTSFGIFVRLNDLYIEGLVHITALGKDYFVYDAAKQRLIGERNRKVFKLGDEMKVVVSSVKLEQKQIDFVIAPEDAEVDEVVDRRVAGSPDNQDKPETTPSVWDGAKKHVGHARSRKSSGSKTQQMMEQDGDSGNSKSGKKGGKNPSNKGGAGKGGASKGKPSKNKPSKGKKAKPAKAKSKKRIKGTLKLKK